MVLETLKDSKAHLSASQIFTLVQAQCSSISLATVYRNLGVLVEQGEILQLCGARLGEDIYDGCTEHHGHFICNSCYSVEDLTLNGNDWANLVRDLQDRGYSVNYTQLRIHGLCPNCNA